MGFADGIGELPETGLTTLVSLEQTLKDNHRAYPEQTWGRGVWLKMEVVAADTEALK